MTESVFERCADCPATVIAEPVPVLGPFIGLVGSVLCSLAGALLLLAPFAFDYRQGAGATPRSSVVDLITGGCVLAVGLLTMLLFGGSLRQRLRASVPVTVTQVAQEPVPESVSEPAPVPEQPQPQPRPEPEPAAEPQAALRDLLTPLVAALAADLRARDGAHSARVDGVDPEGRHS